jgi:diaminopimelate epimerase
VNGELHVTKAHAYGNDFLLIDQRESDFRAVDGEVSADVVRRLCARHTGVGADGVVLFGAAERTTMRLFNADGSPSELSGNGLRCLAALVARRQELAVGSLVTVDTSAGRKTLALLAIKGARYTFRTALGPPEGLRQVPIAVLDETVTASVLSVGNPQCVVLGALPDDHRFNRLGPALSTHSMFPAGTNVEFAHVEAPDRIRILIWERGVGPTSSSGTGSAAAAVAAAAHGGASRHVDVIAPGGIQHVEWREDGIHQTGWAELTIEGTAYL